MTLRARSKYRPELGVRSARISRWRSVSWATRRRSISGAGTIPVLSTVIKPPLDGASSLDGRFRIRVPARAREPSWARTQGEAHAGGHGRARRRRSSEDSQRRRGLRGFGISHLVLAGRVLKHDALQLVDRAAADPNGRLESLRAELP